MSSLKEILAKIPDREVSMTFTAHELSCLGAAAEATLLVTLLTTEDHSEPQIQLLVAALNRIRKLLGEPLIDSNDLNVTVVEMNTTLGIVH